MVISTVTVMQMGPMQQNLKKILGEMDLTTPVLSVWRDLGVGISKV